MPEGNNDWNDSFKIGDLIHFEGDYGYVVKIECDIIYIKWFKHDGIYRYVNTGTGYSAKYFKKVI